MKKYIIKTILTLTATLFVLSIGFNVHSLYAKQDGNIQYIDGPLQYHWADNQLCGDGRTYERCQMDADGDKCDTYNATKPDPPCPDQIW